MPGIVNRDLLDPLRWAICTWIRIGEVSGGKGGPQAWVHASANQYTKKNVVINVFNEVQLYLTTALLILM